MSQLLQGIASQSGETAFMVGWLIANALISAAVATVALRYLPYRVPKQRALLWLIIVLAGAFIPVFGSIGISLAMAGGMRWQLSDARQPFRVLRTPEFDTVGRKESLATVRGSLRSRITRKGGATEQRLQFIAALQHLPVTSSSPVLRTLLDDSVEDIRLIAFGMLDKEEKKITEQIHDLLQRPEPTSESQRYLRDKQLAELYWEMAYSGLVHGDLRNYTLDHARAHAETALMLNDKDAGLHFLAARIHNALGHEEQAELSIHRAISLGIPVQRVQPYLAEFAYNRGDYPRTREILETMHYHHLTSHLRPVVEYWSSRGAA